MNIQNTTLGLLIIVGSALYQEAALAQSYEEALTQQIQAADFNCGQVTKAFEPRQKTRGSEIKVQCDGGSFLYTIIVTPSKRFFVESRSTFGGGSGDIRPVR